MPNSGIEVNKVRAFDRSDSNDVEYIVNDSSHVCLMKLCPYAEQNPIRKEIDYSDFRRFHLRFYLPKFVYTAKNKKISKLIFMFNGLNEIDEYNLYDQIGQVLCRRGIASVLIPMPDHLHRHTRWRYKKPTDEQMDTKPLKLIDEKPERLHLGFLQYMGEIESLYDRIINCHTSDDKACGFYRNLFDPRLRISCLGYSLGGLTALGAFIANPGKFNACFLLNSGIKLKDIKLPPKMISQEKWNEIVKRASDKFVENTKISF